MSRDQNTQFKNRPIAAVFTALLLICGCRGATVSEAKPNARTTHFTQNIQHEGINRSYHIHLPPGFSKDQPTPLVIALHGGGGQGRIWFNHPIRSAANERGVVLVFPNGMNRQWSDGRKLTRAYDDVGFISKVIDRMVSDYGIDPQRVYATGISNGGFMSIRLAMDLSEKIAAIAPVTSQITNALADQSPKYPISVMIVNGTKDPIVPYEGGHIRLFEFGRSRGEILSTASTIEQFRRHNGCGPTPEYKRLPDLDPTDDTQVEIERYTGCTNQTQVTLVKVIGGGHTWPGADQYLPAKVVGQVSREIDASKMIIDFLLKHSREDQSLY